MKIGILSIYLHSNYGGILQAYALQTILKDLGHDAYIINGGVYSKTTFLIKLFKIFRWIAQELKKGKYPKLSNCTIFNHHKLSRFVYKNLKIINDNTITGIKHMNFDVIMVGSDQVWRRYAHINDMSYFYLNFTEGWGIKRLSYAASFGSSEWEYNEYETMKCKEYLKKFNYISVREFEGHDLCNKYLDCDAKVHIDPTMLLMKNDYLNICKKEKGISTNFLTYILDNTKDKNLSINYLEQIMKQKASSNDSTNLLSQKPTIEFWIKSFDNADFVFTDSFHGCVFSIIFNKPFIVYANSERGLSRFNTLLKHFGLQNRMIFHASDIENIHLYDIDWKNVNLKIRDLRNEAINFLTKSLM